MTKLNVMHVTYDMRIGGTEMVIKSIIEGIDKAHFNTSIYCIEEPLGPWGEDLKASGLIIKSNNRREGFDTNLIRKIREQIKAQNIDILHCHQYTPWVYGVFAALGLKTKVIFTEHGRFYPDSSSWKRRLVNPLLSFFTSAITSISNATKIALVEYEFIQADKIRVIHNGIKGLKALKKADAEITALRAEYKIPNDAFIVGTIARMDPIKNHKMMLRAVAECLKANVGIHFVLVGDGEMRTEIEQEIESLKLQANVTLTGYRKDPSRFFNLFDLFLLTSFSEGMSMTLLEAMSIGLPCIVTDVGGNAEVVSDKVTGIVIENDNLGQLTHELISVSQSPQILAQMNIAAVARFRNKFTQAHMTKRYEDCYRDIFQ